MKALAFTFDAVFALMIAAAVIPILVVLTADTSSQQISQALALQAEDAMDVVSQLKVRDVAKEPVISDLYMAGYLDDENLNMTLLEFVSELWASNSTLNNTVAQNITQQIFGKILPQALKWSFSIDNEKIVNASGNFTSAATAGRRVVSGFRKGAPSTGYVSSAFLTRIGGKKQSSYYFFGGFVGQGNITVTITDITQNANVSEIYLEMNAGDNATLALNNTVCTTLNVTTGNLSVNNWSITSQSCLSNIMPGQENNITINFSSANLTNHYIGGGYVRITYSTTDLLETENNTIRYRFPGINGLVNLYDSFYVPGNITAMNANITLQSGQNYTTMLLIGNVTVLNHTGTGQEASINISNSTFAQLFAEKNITFLDMSSVTVPLRMYIAANITGGTLNGTADIILITDTSGSMAWRLDQGGYGTVINNCSDPAIYNSTTARISLAKCLDKSFINAILGGNASACGAGTPVIGNRVGLVSFSSSADNWESLTTNISYLESAINAYTASGVTCISCAINRAYNILALQSESYTKRNKYIIVMTDGQANIRSTPICYDMNDVDLSIAVGESGATLLRTPPWLAANSVNDALNKVSMLNSTFGRAVADGGEIYSWSGSSWILEQDTGSNNVLGVDILNATLGFAVGQSAKIWRWNGATWTEVNDFGSFNFRSIGFANTTLAFAVGDNGNIYTWSGASWSFFQTVGGGSINLYGIDAVPNLAYAAGTSGKIYRWTGSTFSEVTDTGGNTHYDVSILNSTRVFTASSDGRVYTWNGASWTNAALSSNAVRGMHVVNTTLAYAVGDMRGDVYEWNGISWQRTYSAFYYQGTSTTGISCSDDDSCSLPVNESYPSLNANWSTMRAMISLTNLTVDSVGFGPIGSCRLGNETVREIAKTGNGTAYTSANATELQTIYCQIADSILTKSTQTQQLIIEGALEPSKLSPASVITFDYTPATPAAGYQEITVGTETSAFAGCEGSFFIAPGVKVVDALRTSYSGSYWTKTVSVQNAQTGGFVTVYNLSLHNNVYTNLGDPYRVYLPASLLAANATNTVKNELGLNSSYSDTTCSQYDRVIYKARLRASVPIGAVFPEISGGVFRIYYDTGHDGTQDGYTDVTVGATLPNFDPTTKTVDQLDVENDALHDALMRLLDALNLVITQANSGRSGEATNPIDIKLDEVDIEATGTAGVPFAWGPLDVTLEVGI